MDDCAILDIMFRYVVWFEQHVRTGLARERKGAFTILAERYKDHRRDRPVCQSIAEYAHVVFLKRLQQKASKIIVTELSAKR